MVCSGGVCEWLLQNVESSGISDAESVFFGCVNVSGQGYQDYTLPGSRQLPPHRDTKASKQGCARGRSNENCSKTNNQVRSFAFRQQKPSLLRTLSGPVNPQPHVAVQTDEI